MFDRYPIDEGLVCDKFSLDVQWDVVIMAANTSKCRQNDVRPAKMTSRRPQIQQDVVKMTSGLSEVNQEDTRSIRLESK